MKYRLAIVPKMQDNSYGSQFDLSHYPVGETDEMIITVNNYRSGLGKEVDGILFVGLDSETKQHLKTWAHYCEIFVWSNNKQDLFDDPDLFKNISIRFEQSTDTRQDRGKFYYVPTAFQSYALNRKSDDAIMSYDVVFSGSIDRTTRIIEPHYRFKVFDSILEQGFRLINYNHVSQTKKNVDFLYIKTLSKKYPYSFKHVNRWATPEDLFTVAHYNLNMPFPHFGANAHRSFGMTKEDKECQIWYHTWDIFRHIGASPNTITYFSRELKELGVTSDEVHYYYNNPSNLPKMIEEIIDIVQDNSSDQEKFFKTETQLANTYEARWEFMLSKIREYKNLESPSS